MTQKRKQHVESVNRYIKLSPKMWWCHNLKLLQLVFAKYFLHTCLHGIVYFLPLSHGHPMTLCGVIGTGQQRHVASLLTLLFRAHCMDKQLHPIRFSGCNFWSMPSRSNFNSSLPGQNGRHSGRRHFQINFLEWKWSNSYSNFTEMSSQESNWQ